MMKIIQSVNHATQWLVVRLYTRGSSRADRQRGASALEYIVLAAVIIAIIAFLANTDVKDKLQEIFTGLFQSAKDAADTTTEAAGG